MNNKQLDARERRFVEEYLIDLDPKRAALTAGYSRSMAASKAYQWVSNGNEIKPHVHAAIQKEQDARSKRTGVTIDRVLTELAAIGFADMGTYLDLAGGIVEQRNWANLPEGATKVIQEITQEEHTGGRGHDTGEVRRTKFKLYSKLDALEKIARHLGMFTEKLKIEGSLLDELSPNELAALVEHLRAAGFGGAGRGGEETRH